MLSTVFLLLTKRLLTVKLPIYTTLMLETNTRDYLCGVLPSGRFFVILANIVQGGKGLSMTNTAAYFPAASVMKKKVL
jgi:hypothetical protein